MEEPFEQLGKHRSLKMMVFMIIFKVNFSLPFWEREIMPSTTSRQASKKELFHLPNPQVKMQETLFCAICTFLGCFLLALVPWVCPQRSPAVSVTGPTGESQPRTRDAAIRRCTLTFSLAALVATHKFCFFSARGGMAGDDKRLFYLEIAYNNSSQRAGIFVGSQNPPKGAARRAQVTAPVTFSAQICSFSLPLVFQFCLVNKTRPSFAVTSFQSHFCSGIDIAIVGASNLQCLNEISQCGLSESRC